MKVDNHKIIVRIAGTTYRSNFRRNLLTILAAAFTTFLIVSILSIGASYRKVLSERSVRMEGMDYDIELSEPTEKQVELIKGMESVRHAGVTVKCAVVEEAGNRPVSKIQLFWSDETCWSEQYLPAFEIFEGSYPAEKNDIVLSTGALKEMGIENPEINMKIPVRYHPLTEAGNTGEPLSATFRLSGYYRDYSGRARGFVSDQFYLGTGARQTDFTQGFLKISLKNPMYSKDDILEMQKQLNLQNKQVLIADYDTISNFYKTAAGLAGLLFMVFASGFLFIFNTQYISVSKDIRYYGQLKTIGMTSVQLKRVIYTQAALNAGIGIPLGLLLGVPVTTGLVPAVLRLVNPNLSDTAALNVHPLVYAAAVVFSLFTVYMGTRKPAVIAGNCSPIEAIRYIPVSAKGKKRTGGLSGMVWRNIFRDKKQAAVILGSFVISLTVFITIHVVIREYDSKSILDQTYPYDMRIRNEAALDGDSTAISSESISALKAIEGVSEIRVVYSAAALVPYQEDVFGEFYRELYDSRYSPGDYQTDISAYQENPRTEHDMFSARIVGVDENGFHYLNKSMDPQLDVQDFEDGKIALTDSFLDILPADAVGKQLVFSLPDSVSPEQEHGIQIAGIATSPASFAGGYNPDIIVSQKYLREIAGDTCVELVNIDYEEAYSTDTEAAVRKVFEGNEGVTYSSKLELYEEMLQTERQVRVLGNSLGIILAVLAVMNYINMMAAGVQNRSGELAALEGIGMTSGQIRKVLAAEGMGYAVISVILSVIVGVPLSYGVFQSMNRYQVAFSIPAAGNLVLFMVILCICAAVPPVIYQFSQKESIIERLRMADK